MALVAITVASFVAGKRLMTRPRSRSCDQVRRNIEQGEVMAETYSGEFYCVKCKAKREASGEVHVNDKGTRMAKAKCPVCGTNLNRILGRV
jgi:transcription elongation factor Elf1